MSHLQSISYDDLKSSDEEIQDFFLNSFQLLSTKQKKIWQLLQWYSNHYRSVFLSHEKIAEKVGCCRDTVVQTIKKFQEWGWLRAIKRCYRSSVYFIRDCLKIFDTKKDSTFQLNPTMIPTENPTQNPTLYNKHTTCKKQHSKGAAAASLEDEENAKKMFSVCRTFASKRDPIWEIPQEVFLKLIVKHGMNTVIHNANHMCNQQIRAEKDEFEGKYKKTPPVTNPKKYLIRACDENYAML